MPGEEVRQAPSLDSEPTLSFSAEADLRTEACDRDRLLGDLSVYV
jgi:hypothetical protein